MIPATIPRWSRFVTFISVLIPASSFWLFSNYFTLPLRAECGLEVWVLAGCSDLPRDWNWSDIRAERKSKKGYFMQFAEQRSLLTARCQGRGILAEEAANRYDRVRKLCPEDIGNLETNIKVWLVILRQGVDFIF